MNKEDETRKNIKLTAGIIFAAAIIFIAAMTFIVFNLSGLIGEEQPQFSEPTRSYQVTIAPNSGGKAPTLVPSATPEPLQGMDSPMICKMELAGISSRAKDAGASGMLTLNRYEIAKDICCFDIKNMAAFGDIGTIEVRHKLDNDRYGITLRINSSMEDHIRNWSLAALLFFNNGIDGSEAASAVENALANGKAENDLYCITAQAGVEFDGSKVIPVKVIEIVSPDVSAAE